MSDEDPGAFEKAADKAHEMHEKIAEIPLGVLDQIDATAGASGAVRSVHDAATDAAYGAAGKVGGLADKLLNRNKDDETE